MKNFKIITLFLALCVLGGLTFYSTQADAGWDPNRLRLADIQNCSKTNGGCITNRWP
jgi:hypothetical protein